MSTEVKRRRGTSAEHEVFTGGNAEITVNTSDNSLHVHDGITQGGHKIPNVYSNDNRYTATFKNEGGFSAVDNMIAGRVNGIAGAVVHRAGNVYSTGGTTWECKVDGASALSDFKALGQINIFDYDVKPNSAEDSTLKIQDAINSLEAGELYFPSGVYKIGAITGKRFVSIIGDGQVNTEFSVLSGGGLYYSELGGSASLSIKGVGFRGAGTKDNVGISLGESVAHLLIDDVRFSDLGSGLYMLDALVNSVSNVWALRCTAGFDLNSTYNLNLNDFYSVSVTGCDIGFKLWSASPSSTGGYGNTFHVAQAEKNQLAVSTNIGRVGATTFINSYFESNTNITGEDNLLNIIDDGVVEFRSCKFGNSGTQATGFITSESNGKWYMTGACQAVSSKDTLTPPKSLSGTYSLVGVGSTTTDAGIDQNGKYLSREVLSSVASTSNNTVNSFIYGSVAPDKNNTPLTTLIRSNGFAAGVPTIPSPIGVLNAYIPTSTWSVSANATGVSNVNLVFQATIKVVSDSIGIFYLSYLNDGVETVTKYTFNGETEWRTLFLPIDASKATSDNHTIRIVGPSSNIAVWGIQLVSGTSTPIPLTEVGTVIDKAALFTDYQTYTLTTAS